jgi:hypothetical protein
MDIMKLKIGDMSELMKPTEEARDFKLEDFEVEDFADEVDNVASAKAELLMSDPTFLTIINDLKILHNNMLSAHILIKRTRDIVAYLKLRRDHANRMVVRPDEAVIQKMISDSSEDLRKEISNLDI